MVTAVGTDDEGTTDPASDDETVTFDDVAPMIRITKTADPTHVPETGGDVTFTFLVENIGAEDVTLTSLTDTVFGDLDGMGDCSLPQSIPGGGSYSCDYTVFLSSDSGTSWTHSGLGGTEVFELTTTGTNLFAGTDGDGVFLSTNNGTSWSAVKTGFTSTAVRALAAQ